MGQCASVSKYALESALDTYSSKSKSISPVETEPDRRLCRRSLVSPELGPSLARCSPRRPTMEVQPEMTGKSSRDDPEVDIHGLSTTTALTVVSEESLDGERDPSETEAGEPSLRQGPTTPALDPCEAEGEAPLPQDSTTTTAPLAMETCATVIPPTSMSSTTSTGQDSVLTSTKATRRMSVDRKAGLGLPRVQRRMSGGGVIPRFSSSHHSNKSQVQSVSSNEAQAMPRETLSRLGSFRKPNLMRGDSWFVLGFDSNSSSQHYRNMAGLYTREDSWSRLSIPTQHYIPQNTQLRLMRSQMGDSLRSLHDSITGWTAHNSHNTGTTKGDTESLYENSFATCTTRMTMGGDDNDDDFLLLGGESAVFANNDTSNGIAQPTFQFPIQQNGLNLGYERRHSMTHASSIPAKDPSTVMHRRHSQEYHTDHSLVLQGHLA